MKNLTVSQCKIKNIFSRKKPVTILKARIDSGILEVFVYTGKITDDSFEETESREFKIDSLESYNDFCRHLDGNIITGYNAGYDVRILYDFAKNVCADKFIRLDFDILNLARDLLLPSAVKSYRLDDVAEGLSADSPDVLKKEMQVLCVLYKMYISYIPPTAAQTKITKARFSCNDLSDLRNRKILITLTEGKEGDVYYDLENGEWKTRDEEIKKTIWLPEVIRQFTDVYLTPFGYINPEDAAEEWFAYLSSLKPKPKVRKKKS